jgi:3-oxoacyl-[acyl-carrier protein] reductase
MTGFEGRVALVTGASGGIGAELARRLAAAGAAVGIHYSSNREAARRVAGEIGERAALIEGDLFEATAPGDVVEEAERLLGPVDVLAANAGVGRRAAWDEVDAAMFDEALAVNLRAPFLLAQQVLPGMVERGFGRILFTSSVAALTGGIVGPHYAASKAGLHGLTHHLAQRVAADGVTVNAIAPALIEHTGMLPGDPGELAARVPVRRLGTPAEIADLAMAILANGYLTSKVIAVDGGVYPS